MSSAPATPAATPGRFELTRAEAERLTGGRWHGQPETMVVRGAAIDSRAVTPGCVFACLAGARVDGHDFAPAAVAAGAALILADHPLAVAAPVLVVADVTAALAALATEYRARHTGATWIGITGSNGKTTTRELTTAACAGSGAPVHATRGNLNNHLGVPVTVLNAPEDIAYAVIEMGANHQREIAALARIARPDVGAVTAIGPAHLEGFGGLTGVASGKSELFAALPVGAPCFLGLGGLAENARAYGIDPDALLATARVAATGRRLSEVGSPQCPVEGEVESDAVVLRTAHGTARIALMGAHNLANATLAFHLAVAAGVAPRDALAGLAAVRPVDGRLAARAVGAHTIIDDAYNANPGSMVAGFDALLRRPGRHLAVLGAMGELGADSDAAHRRVGVEAALRRLPLITVGEPARPIGEGYRAAGGPDHEHHDGREAAVAAVVRRCAAGATTVLVKASRSARLEAVVDGVVRGLGGGV